SPFQQMKVTRVAVNGRVEEAAVSPDGKHLAYVSSDAGRKSVWVRQVSASSDAKQVVPAEDGRDLGAVTFSRDGEYVYYLTAPAGPDVRHATLRRVPAFGGASQEIIKQLNSPAAFSPDGSQVAFVRADFGGDKPRFALTVARSDGTGERVLARRAGPEIFGQPAWSPDGNRVACSVRTFEPSPGHASLVEVNVSDGAERPLTPRKWYDVGSLAWLPDGRGLVVAVSEEELSPFQLHEISYPEGETRRITNDLNGYQGVSITNDASALVTLQSDLTTHLWVGPSGDPSRAAQVTEGAGRYDGFYGLSWTPDGRVVYASIASGSWDIWVMNADGSGQKQLTVGARSNYGPSVSPDGGHIVFVSNRAGGAFNVWRMDADGSNPLRLTSGQGENFAHVTPDGRWVVYATVGFAQPSHVWKVPIDGGESVRLVEGNASWPFVSPDGKFVACVFQPGPGSPVKLAVVPFDGGPPAKLFDIPPTFRANVVWTPDGRAVTFIDNRDGTGNLWSQPVAGGPARQLTDFKSAGVTAYDWSPDGKRLAAARSAQSNSVVLLRDFR
ncbi:MAG TPA: hypothetical protein VEQ42_12665, partial [Pyrinomonadaceae bacterium]|nr:hypothetical protein [Pyrinomonadaceae bacterium]